MKYIVNDINFKVNTSAVTAYITTLVLFLISVYTLVI